MSIRLSEKHGVNPSLDMCIICGESKGIALLGRMKGDEKAPYGVVTSIEPCDVCREKYLTTGVMIVEMGIDGNPTGHLIVLDEHVFKEEDEPIPPKRIALMESKMFREAFSHVEEFKAKNKE